MTRHTLTIQNPRGIHLRPATLFAEAIRAFPDHEVWLTSPVSGRCQPNSPLDILALGLSCGISVTLEVSGPREQECADALAIMLTQTYDFH